MPGGWKWLFSRERTASGDGAHQPRFPRGPGDKWSPLPVPPNYVQQQVAGGSLPVNQHPTAHYHTVAVRRVMAQRLLIFHQISKSSGTAISGRLGVSPEPTPTRRRKQQITSLRAGTWGPVPPRKRRSGLRWSRSCRWTARCGWRPATRRCFAVRDSPPPPPCERSRCAGSLPLSGMGRWVRPLPRPEPLTP